MFWGHYLAERQTPPDQDSWVHKTFFQSSVVHMRCFLAQASLFFIFCHRSNGFLTATRPVKPAARSLLFTNWDLLTSTSVTVRCPVSRPMTRAVDSQKLTFWFCCGFGSARPIPVRVSSSFQVPFDGVGNCKGRPTLLRVIMVCVSSFVNCLCLTEGL